MMGRNTSTYSARTWLSNQRLTKFGALLLAAIAANAGAGKRWLKAEPPNIDEANDALHSIARDADRAGQVLARIRAPSHSIRGN